MSRKLGRRAFCLGATLVAGLIGGTAGADAALLAPFGSDLSATPTLDIGNGATGSSAAPHEQAVVIDATGRYVHDASDAATWNSAASPADGQARYIKVKGCAVKDPTAPKDTSTGSEGQEVPANSIAFQRLAPGPGGSYAVSGPPATVDSHNNLFALPWCSDSANPATGSVTTSTVTTYEPIHMCINSGEIVDFYDRGGFIQQGAQAWYPQGVPFLVIAPAAGQTMHSFVGAYQQATFGPGTDPNSNRESGLGTEGNEAVQMQVTVGTGDDAYGLCPGGTANEPSSSSDDITCVFDHNPEPGATPCPGWAPKPAPAPAPVPAPAPTPARVTVSAAPPVSAPPTLGHSALNGVANARALLRFVLQSRSSNQPLTRVSVVLPRGINFAGRLSMLARGVSVTASGRRLKVSLRVQRGVLFLSPLIPAARLELKLGWPAVVVSRKLVYAAHRGRAGPAQVVLGAQSAGGVFTQYALSFRV